MMAEFGGGRESKSLVNHSKESGLYLEGLEEFSTIFALHVDGRNVYRPDTVVF